MANEEELRKLRKQMSWHMKTFHNHQTFASDMNNSSVSVEMLQARVNAVTNLAKEISRLGVEMCQMLEEDELEELSGVMATFDESFFTLTTEFNRLIKEMTFVDEGTQSRPSNGLKAPKIDLPKFDGSIGNWIKFKDMFTSMVHNNKALATVVKFHHLVNALEGIPAHQNVVAKFVFEEKNYESAWLALNERLNDEEKLVQFHTDAMNSVSKAASCTASEIQRIIDSFAPHLCGLEQLGFPISDNCDLGNVLVINLVKARLDSITLREFRKTFKGRKATWKLMLEFLEDQRKIYDDSRIEKESDSKPEKKVEKANAFHASYDKPEKFIPMCRKCNIQHYLWDCPAYLAVTPRERSAHVRAEGLCLKCFSSKHKISKCPSQYRCGKCNGPHHTTLHFERDEAVTSTSTSVSTPSSHQRIQQFSPDYSQQSVSSAAVPSFQPRQMAGNTHVSSDVKVPSHGVNSFVTSSQILLSTILLEVEDAEGQWHLCRALLDNASDTSFITTEFANRVGLTLRDDCMPCSGLGGNTAYSRHKAQVRIRSRFLSYEVVVPMNVLPNITGDIPGRSFDYSNIGNVQGYFLADPEFNKAARNDMLLGADIFWETYLNQIVHLSSGPCLAFTRFGWIVGGKLKAMSERPAHLLSSFAFCHVSRKDASIDDRIEAQLSEYFNREEVDSSVPAYSLEEQFCEDLFTTTTTRCEDGRFQVYMPTCASFRDLGHNFANARKVFFAQENSRSKNPTLNELYGAYMAEFIESGHMVEVAPNESDGYFLPHHGVLKLSST